MLPACLLFFSLSPLPHADEGKIELKFGDGTISAHIEGGLLKAVIEKVKLGKRIWFKGKESLFEAKISVKFKDLPIQDGLKRILSKMNYSLVFDQDSKLLGVIILGESESIRDGRRSRTVPPKRTPPRKIPKRNRRGLLPPKQFMRPSASELK